MSIQQYRRYEKVTYRTKRLSTLFSLWNSSSGMIPVVHHGYALCADHDVVEADVAVKYTDFCCSSKTWGKRVNVYHS